MTRHITHIAATLSLTVFLVLGFTLMTPQQEVRASTQAHSLSGFAWSSTIGWVSMSCANFGTCGQSNYSVYATGPDGALAGYAWSPSVGWISFNPSDTAGCPSGECAPRLNRENGQVTGWARAVSAVGTGVTSLPPSTSSVAVSQTPEQKETFFTSLRTIASTLTARIRATPSDRMLASTHSASCIPHGEVVEEVFVNPWGACYAPMDVRLIDEPRCCSGTAVYGGPYRCSVTCQQPSLALPPPTVSLSASPTAITSGQSSTLTWSSTHATSCTGTNFNTQGALSGSISVSPTATTQYSVSCTGSGSIVHANRTITVSPPPTVNTPTPAPTAWDGWIYLGQSSRVGVRVNNACEWGGYAWGGGRNLDTAIIGWLSFSGPGYSVIGEGYSCRAQSTLSVSCAPSSGSVSVAESMTWTASAQGGDGTYTYEWSGTDNLSGAGRTIDRSYATPGIKTASVTVTSGGESATASCANNVFVSGTPNFGASCEVTPSSGVVGDTEFTWSAQVTNAPPPYTYTWEGSEGLSGTSQTVRKTYLTGGEKTGRVTIQSGDESVTVDCRNSAMIGTTGLLDDIMCSASPQTANVGQTVRWSVSQPRGAGFTYSWSGSEGLSGSSAQVDTTYTTPGVKNATVRVSFGGSTRAQQCQMSVEILPAATISFTADRNPVVSGTSTTLRWSVSGMQAGSCSVTGGGVNRTGLNAGSGGSGSISTGVINSETTFTLRCTDVGGTLHTRNITMRVVPSFQEF